MLKQFDVGCSNVTLNQLHAADRKIVSHCKHRKFKDSVAAVYTEYFHQAASHSLDL